MKPWQPISWLHLFQSWSLWKNHLSYWNSWIYTFYVVLYIFIMETNHILLVSILFFFLNFFHFPKLFQIFLSHYQTSSNNQIHSRMFFLQFMHIKLNVNFSVCLKLFKGIIAYKIKYFLFILILGTITWSESRTLISKSLSFDINIWIL